MHVNQIQACDKKKLFRLSLSLSLSLSLCTHQWNDCEDYEIIRKVGRGKYSEVFEGWRVSSEDKVCVCVYLCVCMTCDCVSERVCARVRAGGLV